MVRWCWVNFLIWIGVGQGPTALAVGAGGGCLAIFLASISPSLCETARYRLNYCLKTTNVQPKTTNHPIVPLLANQLYSFEIATMQFMKIDFDIVNFSFLDGDVPHSTSYGVYISQLIRFARVPSHVDDFNTRNHVLTAKLLRQGYRYLKPRKAFSKFNRRHFDIVSKYNVGLKTLLLQGLSEPEFYGDLVYKFRKIIGKNDFPYHYKKIIVLYKEIGYNIDVLRQTHAWLLIQSRLTALLTSLIARRQVGFQTE